MVLDELLGRNARRYPGKTALVDQSYRLTFDHLNRRVNALANGLLGLGLRKGDRVVIMADAGHQHIELSFATLKCGLVTAPLNPGLPPQDLTRLVANTMPSAVVFGENCAGLADALRPTLEGIEHRIVLGHSKEGMAGYEDLIDSSPTSEPGVPLHEDDPLYMVCSGGTTGLPKQIVHNYRSCLATMLNTMWLFDTRHDDVCLWATPAFWGHMIPWLICPHYYAGATVVILRDPTPQSLLRTIQEEHISTSMMGSSFMVALMDCIDLHRHSLGSLRRLAVGGMPLPAESWRRARETFGEVVGQVYGQSEMSPIAYLFPGEVKAPGMPQETRRLASTGREVINVEARVVAETGEAVPPGEVGEVIARGDSMMAGYWNNPQATAKAMRHGWLYTGDLGFKDEDGYLHLVGRQADVITSAGRLLSPTEIEDAISRHPAVQEAAAIGVPHPILGEAVQAVVVLKREATATPADIIELCRGCLPQHAVPLTVEFVTELPRSPVGKVLKNKLREAARK